jgi:hypothetical protein
MSRLKPRPTKIERSTVAKNLHLTPHGTLHYKVLTMLLKRSIAAIELLLILPATSFMLALFLRNVQPAPYQPAEAARHLVDWFAARPHIGLQLFLISFPFAALLLGAATLLRIWRQDPNLRQLASTTLTTVRSYASFLLIAASTLLAFAILSIVALHLLTD